MKVHQISSRILAVLFLVISSVTPTSASEALSDEDRKVMIKKLEEIQATAKKSSMNRFGTAMKAFRRAMKSDVAAHDLYIKCVEKADFSDQKRSSQQFREWKRNHKDRHNTLEFRRVLQHQLSWLLLSIEAAANPDDIQTLGIKALKNVDAIMDDQKILKPHRHILKQNVLSSVYAKAYNIDGLKAKDWPMSPLNISEIYDKVVMPPLRETTSINQLRGAWDKRIEHEGQILKHWSAIPKTSQIGMAKDLLLPEYTKWQEAGYLELLWKKEMDCFKAGDEKQSSAKMLSHLSKYIKHKQSLKWTKQFQKLMAAGLRAETEPYPQDE